MLNHRQKARKKGVTLFCGEIGSSERIAQIEEKQYETTLIAKGISKEKIRKYGFAFEGKNVLIG